jgi:hypothetical protein
MHCTHIYYNYLLITDRIVKNLALSIVSLQLAVSKIFSSDFKVCFHILQSIGIEVDQLSPPHSLE